jgi:hypothetical protein
VLPPSSNLLTLTVVLSRDSIQVYTPYPQFHLQCLENEKRSWQEGDLNPQQPFPIPSDNDPINLSIYPPSLQRLSSIGWSLTLQRHLCLHWGLPCPTSCCKESQATPSNSFNGPGHSSRLYRSILTANGLPKHLCSWGNPLSCQGHTQAFPHETNHSGLQ